MGFFSWNCKGCGHPLLSGYVTNQTNSWMGDGVAITAKGKIIRGNYDGYGRLDDCEFHKDVKWLTNGSVNEPDVYHKTCWDLMGNPAKYGGVVAVPAVRTMTS